MRKKIMIFASAALLCGCAGNIDVSYVDNTEINVVSSEVADETSSVGEIVNPDGYFWKESYALKGNDDKEYTVRFEAEVNVPYDISKMTVYEYDYVKILSAEKKEQILNRLFGNEQLYSYRDECMPKKYFEKQIEEDKKNLNEYEIFLRESGMGESEIENELAALRDRMDDYMELMEKAPAEPVVISDYDENRFWGYIDGHPYSIIFDFYDNIDEFVNKAEVDLHEGELLDYRVYVLLKYVEKLDDNPYVSQELSNADAATIAEKYLEQLGIEDVYKVELVDKPGVVYVNEDLRLGYVQGKADFGVENRGEYSNAQYMNYDTLKVKDKDGNEIEMIIPQYRSMIVAGFSEGNLFDIRISTYLEVADKKESVPILGLSDIIAVVKSELEENTELYSTDDSMLLYDEMSLGYESFSSANCEKVSCIPCYRVSSSVKLGKSIMINAMDGTVIKEPEY